MKVAINSQAIADAVERLGSGALQVEQDEQGRPRVIRNELLRELLAELRHAGRNRKRRCPR